MRMPINAPATFSRQAGGNAVPIISGRVVSTADAQPLIRSVSWTGNGAATQDVDVGFQPDLILGLRTGNNTWFWHRFCWRFWAPKMGTKEAGLSATVTAVSTTGFTVGSECNVNGTVYHALCIADNGSNKLYVGSYAGDATDNRQITTPFAPIYVAVKRDNVYACWTRSIYDTTGWPLTAEASNANLIKTLNSTGFTVGTAEDINGASDTFSGGAEAYDFWALASCQYWRVRQYVGNAAADREIDTLPTRLAAALVKSHDTSTSRAARLCFSTMSTGQDVPVTGTVATGVMSIASGALVLQNSNEVNGSGILNTVVAFAEQSGFSPQAVQIPTHTAVRIGTSGGVICETNNAALARAGGVPLSIELVFERLSTATASLQDTLFSRAINDASRQYGVVMDASIDALEVNWMTVAATTVRRRWVGLRLKHRSKCHLVVTFDGAGLEKYYVDGTLAKVCRSSTTIAASSPDTNAKVAIGCQNSTGSRNARAEGSAFALARLYDVELTAAQVAARYRRGFLKDFSADDVKPLEEWDAENVVGTTWYATFSATNNGTLHANDTLATI